VICTHAMCRLEQRTRGHGVSLPEKRGCDFPIDQNHSGKSCTALQCNTGHSHKCPDQTPILDQKEASENERLQRQTRSLWSISSSVILSFSH
jgi:hypothetical protein